MLPLSIQIWPKKFVLGCAISPLRQQAESSNLGHSFLANSVDLGLFELGICRNYVDRKDLHSGFPKQSKEMAPCNLTAPCRHLLLKFLYIRGEEETETQKKLGRSVETFVIFGQRSSSLPSTRPDIVVLKHASRIFR